MVKDKYETVLDYGSSKIRAGVIDTENSLAKFFIEEDCKNSFVIKNLITKGILFGASNFWRYVADISIIIFIFIFIFPLHVSSSSSSLEFVLAEDSSV